MSKGNHKEGRWTGWDNEVVGCAREEKKDSRPVRETKTIGTALSGRVERFGHFFEFSAPI